MTDEDWNLLRALERGDRRAFDVLVSRWSPRVMAIASRVLRDPERARDVHQQAFLRLWAGASGFSGRSSFSTWLHRVVLNLCRDTLRTEALRGKAAEEAVRVARRTGPAAPDVDAGRAEMARRVAAAVRSLPEDEREVLVMRHYAGMTFREVAEVLDIPLGTAKTRMSRALDRLRQRLGDVKR